MKKRYAALALAALMAVGSNMTAFAGWEQGTGQNVGKWRYTFDDGSTARDTGLNNGFYIKDREGEGKAYYYFDADGWLYTEPFMDPYLKAVRNVNEYGQLLDKNGQVLRPEGYSTSAKDSRLQNIDKWVYQDGKTFYRFADGTYAKGEVWLDPFLRNETILYSFDSGGERRDDIEWQSRTEETVSLDDSILRQEGFTKGFSNTAFYILTHTMDEVNAKYEIEKATGSESHHAAGGITNRYYIKYKGIPVIAHFYAGSDNVYKCERVEDLSPGRNALMCDVPDPNNYDTVKSLLEGVNPYYDWIGVGGAIISYSFPGFNDGGYLYFGYDTDYDSPDQKIDAYSWTSGYAWQ